MCIDTIDQIAIDLPIEQQEQQNFLLKIAKTTLSSKVRKFLENSQKNS